MSSSLRLCSGEGDKRGRLLSSVATAPQMLGAEGISVQRMLPVRNAKDG